MSYYVQTILCPTQHGGGTDTCCWVGGGGPAGTIATAVVWFAADNAGHWLQEQVQVHGSAEEGCWLATVTCWVSGDWICWTVAVVGTCICPDSWGGGAVVSVTATDVAEGAGEMKDV